VGVALSIAISSEDPERSEEDESKDLLSLALTACSHQSRICRVTLVIGAGVSIKRGIPSWSELAQAVWKDVFPRRRSPWVRDRNGYSPAELPQFLPIVFELVYRELKDEARFFAVLRKHLYAMAQFPRGRAFAASNVSLAVIARLVVAEYNRGAGRRIQSIITFNADDLIEQAIGWASGMGDSDPPPNIAGAVARSTHRLIPDTAVPIYHVHGFLPSDGRKRVSKSDHRSSFLGPERMLVFTDSQYWSTSAGDFSFANRIVNTALSENVCVFIGLSMQDINLLRWLALRALDRDRDQFDFGKAMLLKWLDEREGGDSQELLFGIRNFLSGGQGRISPTLDKHFRRHFWIRPPQTDPGGFLTEFLSYRGVNAVDIRAWKDGSFQRLMSMCFPAGSTTKQN
jgi:hypothetical protein